MPQIARAPDRIQGEPEAYLRSLAAPMFKLKDIKLIDVLVWFGPVI